MSELQISIEGYHPLDLFGPNDLYLELVRKMYPKLKIIARGEQLKVIGSKTETENFRQHMLLLMVNFDKFGKISEQDVKEIMQPELVPAEHHSNEKIKDVLVYGRDGSLIRAQTANQRKMVHEIDNKDLLFAIGPAGTGKTYTAVALAVRALKNKEVKRIVLTRPAVEAGENLGFLPGDLKDKLDPYLQPLYDALRDMLPTQKLLSYMEDGTIEIAPLAFMRGRTLGNSFTILDEAQNTTPNQLKMFLTRMGKSSKFIVTGDITQVDLPRHQKSGLMNAAELFKNIPEIGFVYLDKNDIIRHKLVTKIIQAYEKEENDNQ